MVGGMAESISLRPVLDGLLFASGHSDKRL
jgi:hypothetical protein